MGKTYFDRLVKTMKSYFDTDPSEIAIAGSVFRGGSGSLKRDLGNYPKGTKYDHFAVWPHSETQIAVEVLRYDSRDEGPPKTVRMFNGFIDIEDGLPPVSTEERRI